LIDQLFDLLIDCSFYCFINDLYDCLIRRQGQVRKFSGERNGLHVRLFEEEHGSTVDKPDSSRVKVKESDVPRSVILAGRNRGCADCRSAYQPFSAPSEL